MEQFDFQLNIFSLIVGGGFFLAIVSSIFVGPLMDFLGRKSIFQWVLILVTIATFLTGVAWNFSSLVIFRLIATGSAFVEYAVGATILMESVPKKHRGWTLGVMAAGWPAGTALAGIITLYTTPSLGWRSAFFIATIPAFIIIVIRLFVNETEPFQKNVEKENALQDYHKNINMKDLVNNYKRKFHTVYRKLLSGTNLYNSVLVWIYINTAVFPYSLLIWFAPYWMSDVFRLSLVQTNTVTVVGSFISIIGFISCGWLGGLLNIRKANIIFLPTGILLFVTLSYFLNNFSGFLIIYFLWNFFGAGIWGIIPRLFTEKFHTSIRGTAASISTASCWLGWGVISFFSPFLLENVAYHSLIFLSILLIFPFALISMWLITKS